MEQGWQPIETAPKDGSRVDVWAAYGNGNGSERGERHTSARWRDGCWISHSGVPLEWSHPEEEDAGANWREVTHWMPLPGAPDTSPNTRTNSQDALIAEALAPFAAIASDRNLADHEDSYAPRPSRGRPNMADYRRALAALATLAKVHPHVG
jgi:hypothetical protein